MVRMRRPVQPNDCPDWLLKCGHTAWSWPYITHFGESGKHKYLWCDICDLEVRVKSEKTTVKQRLTTQQKLRELKLF